MWDKTSLFPIAPGKGVALLCFQKGENRALVPKGQLRNRSSSGLFTLFLKTYWHWHIFGLLLLRVVKGVTPLSKGLNMLSIIVAGYSWAESPAWVERRSFFNFKHALYLLLGSFLWLEQFVIFCNCSLQFLSSRKAVKSSDKLLSEAKETILKCLK